MKSGMQPQPSAAQQEFLEQEQFHKRKVATCRVMLLVLLLAIWELCARLGIIDDFIFSSPSRVFFCFRDMVLDGSIFEHIGITLFETLVSFALVVVIGVDDGRASLVQPQHFRDSGAVPCHAQQPA